MKKIVITLYTLLCVLSLQAQHAGNSLYNGEGQNHQFVPNTQPKGVNLGVSMANTSFGNRVSLKADVMINVKATSYIVIFSATQVNETFEMADSALNQRFRKFINALKRMGINDQDVHIDFLSIVPVYEMEITKKKHSITGNEIATGFELKKNIHIRVRNTALIDNMVAAAAYSEVYDLVKVDYIVDNMEAVYQQLRLTALEIIKMKRLPYEQTGLQLKQLDLGETRGSTYPAERYASYTAYNSGTPAFYKEVSAKTEVQMNYANKNQTVYYEKVPFGQFDHVINADVAEPCVQFYFALMVNYNIVDEEAKAREKEERDYILKKREIELDQLRNQSNVVRKNPVLEKVK